MKNKQSLMHLVARAERGSLLPEEAKMLRDAIELLDDIATTLDKVMNCAGVFSTQPPYEDYEPTSTIEFRAVSPMEFTHECTGEGTRLPGPHGPCCATRDDDAPGRP